MAAPHVQRLLDVFWVATRLGLTSFGGPIAHLGYFRDAYVVRHRWLSDARYADLIALAQCLPGPTSSQVGIGIGFIRAGLPGAIVSFLGFTWPSALLMVGFARFAQAYALEQSGMIHGLKLAAVAIVAHAVLGMARTLTPDRARRLLALATALGFLAWRTPLSQVVLLALAALYGRLFFKAPPTAAGGERLAALRRSAAAYLAAFAALLVLLPLLRAWSGDGWIALVDTFYRSGSLVFGGGHVVLPLLERELGGQLGKDAFLAGYGAAQLVPGPLFTFAAYAGALLAGLPGALLATAAIFLPGFLLVAGGLPYWDRLRAQPRFHAVLSGVNAAVVGLLAGALYDPVITGAVAHAADAALALALLLLLIKARLAPVIVALLGAGCGLLLF